MKKILLLAVATALILVACREINKQAPKFNPGDLVKTKFGETVLIIDTTDGWSTFRGSYTIKRKGATENEVMNSAELADLSEASTLE